MPKMQIYHNACCFHVTLVHHVVECEFTKTGSDLKMAGKHVADQLKTDCFGMN